MNKVVKLIIALAAIVSYFLVLRFIAPSQEPYFILGIALIGFTAWLYGMAIGLVIAVALIPTTLYIYAQFSVSTSYMGFASSPAYIALEILTAVMLGRLRKKNLILSQKESDLADANEHLQNALAQVREFGGVHSLCSGCKKILDDDGDWKKIDTYLKEKTKAEFSHGDCPDCVSEYKTQSAPKTTITVP
jgi:hypothetical protein